MTPALTQLAETRQARARLDEQELDLLDRARHQGATWTEIATALGLASRQAAQQRHQRLTAAAQARRNDLDVRYAPHIATVRAAVADLGRWIEADRRWDARFVRAALVRSTVTAALDAAPGSLYALASHVAADLAEAGPQRLPAPARLAAVRLGTALSTYR